MKKLLIVCVLMLMPSMVFASKIHVLEGSRNGIYKVVIHEATPNGNNSAGKTWKSCILSAVDPVTVTILIVGTNPGNITQAEADSIIAGDTLEIIGSIRATSNAARTELVDNIINNKLGDLQRKYQFYGFEQN